MGENLCTYAHHIEEISIAMTRSGFNLYVNVTCQVLIKPIIQNANTYEYIILQSYKI